MCLVTTDSLLASNLPLTHQQIIYVNGFPLNPTLFSKWNAGSLHMKIPMNVPVRPVCTAHSTGLCVLALNNKYRGCHWWTPIQFNLCEDKYDPKAHNTHSKRKLAANYFTLSPLACFTGGHGCIKHELPRTPQLPQSLTSHSFLWRIVSVNSDSTRVFMDQDQ